MTSSINLLEKALDTGKMQDKPTQKLVEVLEHVKQRQSEEKELIEGRKQVKHLIEALLFACNDPLSLNKIREVCDEMHPLKPRILRQLIDELNDEYLSQGRAFEICEIAGGFALRSRKEYGPYIEKLYRNRRLEKLSPASSEVLAIIAYRQPITRAQIDRLRGVDSSGTLYSLMERGLIEVQGRLEAPGRPSLYGCSAQFLKYFGLNSIEELPHYQEMNSSKD